MKCIFDMHSIISRYENRVHKIVFEKTGDSATWRRLYVENYSDQVKLSPTLLQEFTVACCHHPN